MKILNKKHVQEKKKIFVKCDLSLVMNILLKYNSINETTVYYQTCDSSPIFSTGT